MSQALPVSVHKMNGTYQKCRHEDAEKGQFVFDEGYPEPPRELNNDYAAMVVWEEIRTIMEASKIYTQADAEKLARYCVLIAEFRATLAGFPVSKLNPLRSLEKDLYLCPTARAKLGVKQKEPENAFDKFK